MPEGHTLHRLARQQQRLFGGVAVHASSPQGRFADGAALIDGHVLARTEAYGKHLLHHYQDGPLLHVHLGLYGKFTTGTGEPPAPVGALRLRLIGQGTWTDLRGPTACELMTPVERTALLARLGPDPLRRDVGSAASFVRIVRSKAPVAALLMDQSVLAGVGNVYRAEVLFRHQVDPYLPGRELHPERWDAIWRDLRVLMATGVRVGRIVTLRPEDRPRGRRPAVVAPGDDRYVYWRTGLPCRICGTEVRLAELVGRNLYWCPCCQAPGLGRTAD